MTDPHDPPWAAPRPEGSDLPGWAAPPPTYPPPMYYPPPYGPAVYATPPKSKVAAALLAFFLGILGIHNFYLGRTTLGITQLLLATIGGICTLGIATLAVAIWAFVEFILILTGSIKDADGRDLA